MRRIAAATLAMCALALAVAWAAAQDDPAPPAPEICPNFNKCRKKGSSEKKECPDCGKRKIYSDDAACSACARKAEICRLCGLPKTARPGRGAGGGLDGAAASITGDDMREFLMKFAGDEMQGRNTGSDGIRKARAFLLDHLKKAGAKPIKGDGFELPWSNCANVGTFYEGSDPKLKDEYVIVGSHMDHIGMGGGGGDTINNGADDNGSGSTTNKEICEALFTSGIQTKRSIINLWFTAEEKGLLGSKGYCQNPALPLDRCVAMLNCDMLGRNPDKPATLWGVGSSPQFSAVVDRAGARFPKANVTKDMAKGPYFHRSDQANFWNAGVPVMFISTGMHADYHKASDHPDKIAYDRMAELGKYMLFILIELANSDVRPEKSPNY